MLVGSLEISMGDLIWANRPLYNKCDEIMPDEKRIRPFLVIKEYPNGEVLVVSLTSNYKHACNIWLKSDYWARTNDLYLINKRDIINVFDSIDEKQIDLVFEECFYWLNNGNVLYDEIIKERFLDEYNKRYLNKEINYYEPYTIIYSPNNIKQKYIIDEVCDDKYLVYRVKIDDSMKIEYDFTNQLFFDKEVCYKKVSGVDVSEYLNKKKSYFKRIKKYVEKSPRKIGYDFETGDLILYEDKEYFVIFRSTGKNNLICVPYQGNYLLSELFYISKPNMKHVKLLTKLDDSEVLSILKLVYNNLEINQIPKLKDKIYVKMMKY